MVPAMVQAIQPASQLLSAACGLALHLLFEQYVLPMVLCKQAESSLVRYLETFPGRPRLFLATKPDSSCACALVHLGCAATVRLRWPKMPGTVWTGPVAAQQAAAPSLPRCASYHAPGAAPGIGPHPARLLAAMLQLASQGLQQECAFWGHDGL